MEYIIQWSHSDNKCGYTYSDNRKSADKIADHHAIKFGGLACVVRSADGMVVYRVWNVKEESAHAA